MQYLVQVLNGFLFGCGLILAVMLFRALGVPVF